MATTLLIILIYCLLAVITLSILYWIIKKAVKFGILEAFQEMKHPSDKVQYPIKINEDFPDLPFNEETKA